MTRIASYAQIGASVVLAASSIAVVLILLKAPPTAEMEDPRTGNLRPTWEEYANSDKVWGSTDAPHTLVLFTDFECSVCRQYGNVLVEVKRRLGDSLRIVVRSFPQYAIGTWGPLAAVAAACAADQHAFPMFFQTISRYSQEEQPPLWSELASRSGITDESRFLDCIEREESLPDVAEDVRMGHQLGIRLLPTVWLDYRRLNFAPSADAIVSRVRGDTVAS